MRIRPVRGAAFLLGLAVAAACWGCGADPGPEPGPPATGAAATGLRCERGPPDPASLANPGGLAGSHRLVLVAGTGPAAGNRVSGTLHLVAIDSAAAPFRGWTDVPAEQLGASVPGDAAALEPAAPGVRVLIWPAVPDSARPPSVTIRLGSHANREGPPLFDEAYAVLHVHAIGSSQFTGAWASGGARPDVEGHFCAVEIRDVGPS